MQKVINVLAILSFLGSASLIGGAGYVLLQREALLESVKKQVTQHATEAITNALPGMLDSAVPEVPEVTGGAIPGVPPVQLP